jgi:hypothetical protein
MDDIVKAALAKWPNVPHCTGWLLLDRRGNWRMRDEADQKAGRPGSTLRHAALIGFINRNYQSDNAGRWYFQNGPQRVYVELEYTPWIVRLVDSGGGLQASAQTGAEFVPARCLADDAGGVLLVDAARRVAAVHDHDLDLLVDHAQTGADGAISAVRWRRDAELPVEPVARAAVAGLFHFIPSPAAEPPFEP